MAGANGKNPKPEPSRPSRAYRDGAHRTQNPDALKVFMHLRGVSYRDIAKDERANPEKLSVMGVRDRVVKHLARQGRKYKPDRLERLRTEELARLEVMRAGVWERATKGNDDFAIQSALKIHAAVAELTGIRVP